MEADEEGTHERLKAHLGELVNPKIAEHRGRVVKNTGDGPIGGVLQRGCRGPVRC
jgi:adenylate cyclase